MRINKFISHNTNYSRREADELVKNGKVSINNKVIDNLATDVKEDDKIKINGRFIRLKKEFSIIVYNKQKGELVTKKDDRGRKTIYDNLPRGISKFISIGRLDFASEGLLLLTDAPAIAEALMGSDIEREYYLKIKGEITPNVIAAMQEGFFAKDATKGAHARTKQISMEFKPFLAYKIISFSGGYTRLKVIINEGQNRELRRFFGYFDLEVMDLKRVSFGRVSLDQLGEGKWRYFTNSEYDDLRDFLKQNGVRY
ncbi:rRNA pseudouridine synthase [Campylobacter fetus]|uniref:Pseudouridine synthase n=3 Tax=Campylobacter fetus TaxID=196 RepID=A0A5L4ZS19_CAMFE|nr:pseudouridine synthase [Campylobacter fetus]OCS22068.1 pseudouridine synthase [Campylobacter fetus subsp. venerealis cfvi97/532]OCS26411.1 pseudouridine synthase [Campylobacter fetus subsp. venerealis cfvB10]OCS29808.1 pseudouridine synthase [Campylobacter fetus subsp. venerealis LMG 6570 = CCUG 33900]OCS42794.1 pseudouridine synthase [Campylobacter fetus subsp. venerealis cfvi02/298]ABK83040.1 pseudouridine synthase, Rsu:RNA-binding S4:Pseudouridine synthase [Campylobacter fetus subsp. fet